MMNIELLNGNRYLIYSPEFLVENGMYENNLLCQYNIPACPQGTLGHLEWIEGLFELEPPQQSGGFTICEDYVEVFNLRLEDFGVEVDSFGKVCGTPSTFQERIFGPLQVS